MKKLTLLSICILYISNLLYAQRFQLQWSDEIKTKNAASNSKVILADESGVYVTRYFEKMPFGSYRLQTHLILMKYDKRNQLVYEHDYNDELRDHDLKFIRLLDNELFLFSKTFEGKDAHTFNFHITSISKDNGTIKEKPVQFDSYTPQNKNTIPDFLVKLSADEKKFIITRDHNTDNTFIGIMATQIGKEMSSKIQTPILINMDQHLFKLVDIQVAPGNKWLVTGRESEYGGKKNKEIIEKGFIANLYDASGKKETSMVLTNPGIRLRSVKTAMFEENKLILAGLYEKGEERGVLTAEINLTANQILQSELQPFTPEMFGFDLDDEKNDKKDKKEPVNFSNYRFKDILLNPVDNSIIYLIEEQWKTSVIAYTGSGTAPRSVRTVSTFQWINGNIMVLNVKRDGAIKWVKVVPKFQLENWSVPQTTVGIFYADWYNLLYFDFPFYSSYGKTLWNNQLILIFNDNPANIRLTGPGPVKRARNWNDTEIHALIFDLNDGKVTRKLAGQQETGSVALPRHLFSGGSELYFPAQHLKIGKDDFIMGKMTIK